LRHWQIQHTLREGNRAAHGLARAAVKLVMNKIWIEEIPEDIRDVVLLELCALSTQSIMFLLCLEFLRSRLFF
jgi:hypothetical protein